MPKRLLVAAAALASNPEGFDPMDRAISRQRRARLEAAEARAGARLSATGPLPGRDATSGALPGSERLASRQRARRRRSLALCRLDTCGSAVDAVAVEAMARRGMRVLGGRRRRALDGRLPDPTRLRLPLRRVVGLADPLRADGAGGGRRVPRGRHPRGHDHRRLSRRRRSAIARRRRHRHALGRRSPAGNCATDRTIDAGASAVRRVQRLRPHPAGAEAAAGAGAAGQRRGRRHDRRRRERRAGAQGRAHRHRHGRPRHRRRARGRARSCCSTTTSARSSTPCGWAGGSTTTCARRWATSSRCTCRSPGMSLLPLLPAGRWCSIPVHIVFLEFIIDPACSIVFEAEAEEPDVMRRPPRSPDARLFSPTMLMRSLLQGALALLTVAGRLCPRRAAAGCRWRMYAPSRSSRCSGQSHPDPGQPFFPRDTRSISWSAAIPCCSASMRLTGVLLACR